MANDVTYNENLVKEQVYTEEKNQVQSDINTIKAEEAAIQEKPVSKNIFVRMSEAFKKNQVDRELERHEKEHIKKEYEAKISEARKARKMADIDQKYKDKLAYEQLTREEKAARTKEKITKFSDKLSAGLGTFGKSEFVNIASKGVERNVGAGSSMTGGLPGGDRIAAMMGGRRQVESKGKYVASSGGDMFNSGRITSMIGGGNKIPAERNPTSYLPKANIGGAASKAGKLLGATSTRQNFPSYFGQTKTDVSKHIPKFNTGKRDIIKGEVKPNLAFERALHGETKVVQKPVKGKAIEMVNTESKEAKMKRLIGL